MTDSERLEQAASKVLCVWANDKRTPEEWIAALSDLWAAVHEYRASLGWWNCQKHGKTAHQCTCGAATAYVQNAGLDRTSESNPKPER
jgi:hypothetical protein